MAKVVHVYTRAVRVVFSYKEKQSIYPAPFNSISISCLNQVESPSTIFFASMFK